MKLKTWTCGTLAGFIATIVLTILSMSLSLLNVIPLSITEYAARFILYLDSQDLNFGRWIVGFIGNFSLGGVFGLLSAYLYKVTGREEWVIKTISIGVCCWFFQLTIVPALSPEVAKYSTYDMAIAYFIIYLIWSYFASTIIIRYLEFPPKDNTPARDKGR
ncbi:MAG: DUF6789 family protein [Dehalobacterium sp.]